MQSDSIGPVDLCATCLPTGTVVPLENDIKHKVNDSFVLFAQVYAEGERESSNPLNNKK